MTSPKVLPALIFCLCFEAGHAAVTVGTCRPSQHSYTTIASAIQAVHPNDVIQVCPGTYAEQLTITKPLAIQGIVIPNQPGVTIVPPAAGLQQIPANSGAYPQIYVRHTGGTVKFSGLSVDGTNASVIFGNSPYPAIAACEIGFIKDFSGITFFNTAGEIAGINVTGHFVSSFYPGDPIPQEYPNCGSGIEFNNRGEEASVTSSVINGFGFVGIFSSGMLTADHNVILGTNSGPYQVGIEAGPRAKITGNTVSGGQFTQSIGIEGGELVQGNIVQSWTLGIVNSENVNHNTLLNDLTGISGAQVAGDNLITAPASYLNPACAAGGCAPGQYYLPTIGIDLKCEDGSQMTDNGLVGVGMGFANVKAGEVLPPSNLFANVAKPTSACAQ